MRKFVLFMILITATIPATSKGFRQSLTSSSNVTQEYKIDHSGNMVSCTGYLGFCDGM